MSLAKKLSDIRLLPIMAAALLIFASLFSACAAPAASATANALQRAPSSSPAVVTGTAPLFDEATTVAMYEQCIPAVVQIESIVEISSKLPMPFSLSPNQEGLGSGFFIDGEGHILTNYHVIDRASKVKVVLDDGTKMDASVVGTDKHNDLALLQVNKSEAGEIKYLTLGDSDTVKPGQMAIALGSPYGLQGSITVGVVSGVGRSLPGSADRTMTNIIQTDAAINPGNSGGPLLNSRGEVIGINTAIEYNANSLGFAVPVNTAKAQLPELLKGGEVKTAWLGIEGTPVTPEMAKRLNLKVEKGVYVVGVLKDSPAARAGLIEGGVSTTNPNEPSAGGDIITAVDGHPVATVQDLLSYFNNKRPGDKVTLSVQRGDQQLSVPVEMGEWPDNLGSITATPNQSPNEGLNGGGDGYNFDFGPFHFRFK